MDYNLGNIGTGYDMDLSGGTYDTGVMQSAYSSNRNEVTAGSRCPTGGRCGANCTSKCRGL